MSKRVLLAKTNPTPPSTRENSYRVPPQNLSSTPKSRIFSPFIPSHKAKAPFEPDSFLLNLPSKTARKRPIIDMTIDIGGDIEKKVLIFEGDESSSLARAFCIENRLDLQCCELISQEIERQIMGYYEKKATELKKKGEVPQRKKHKSLHFEQNDKKLKKHRSLKSFKEDFSEKYLSSSSENEAEKLDEKHAKTMKKMENSKNKEKFNKLSRLQEIAKKNEEECTFHPKINGPNSLFYEETSNNSSQKRFEKLYSTHKQNQQKRSKVLEEFVEETCTFQPEINRNMKKPAKKEELVDRMYGVQKKWDKNREEREKFEKNYDLKTGQKLFQPVIKKDKYYDKAKFKELHEDEIKMISPKNENQQKKLISEAINSKNSKISPKIEEKERKNKQIVKKIAVSGIGRSSSQKTFSEKKTTILSKREKELLKGLFRSLDSNNDDKISRNQIDFSQLDTDLLEIIAGLALDVFRSKEMIDFEEFIRILEQENLKNNVIKVSFTLFLRDFINIFE